MATHLVVDLLFGKTQSCRNHTRRDDGMVVGDLAVVEHLLALGQLLARQGRGVFGIVGQPRQDVGTLGIDVITQIGGIHTRISGVFLLVETLDGLQGLVGRHVVFLVAFHLQRGQVIEPWRSFGAFLGGDVGHGELLPFHALQVFLSVFHRAIFALGSGESRIPINEKTSSNKDLLDLKYEIFFIFENNFSYIYKIISEEILFKFCDKVKTIKIYSEHIDKLVGIINEFFYSHGFLILSDQNLVKEYNEFKLILNKIVLKHSNNLLELFGIHQNFNINCLMPKLNNFNTLLKDIQELI